MRNYFKMYLLLCVLACFNHTADAQPSIKDGWDDMILVRKRIIAELMKGGVNDQQVRQIISTYRSTGDFSDIDYSDLSTTAGFPHQKHLSNLYTLAKAYQTNASVFFHDAEIMKDIEMRVAELLTEKQKSDTHVINNKDVDEVIVVMGQPEDYRIDDDATEPKAEPFYNIPNRKKLYRDKDRGLIGGVCTGLGHYFGVEAVWIKIIFLSVCFCVCIIEPVANTIWS